MDRIEQAVFTSAETDRSAGYQVVATSSGVCDADVRELSVWGPSHDALLERGPSAASVNFHPLPSGSYCVSRTTAAGWEYSGRGGARVYTQCLLVPPQTLLRFANNPFALLRAAMAAGSVRAHRQVPKRLQPLRLPGRAAPVDTTLLARLSQDPGPDWLASLAQAALSFDMVAVAAGPAAEHVIAGLVNCLPPECRTDFSFSTGLKFSPRRPFRVVAFPTGREELRRIQRLYGVAALDFSDAPPAEFAPIDGWPRFIRQVLRSRQTSFLRDQFSRRESEISLDDLPALGLQLLEELDASSLDLDGPNDSPEVNEPPEERPGAHPPPTTLAGPSPNPAPPDQCPPGSPPLPDSLQRAHEAHLRLQHDSGPPVAPRARGSACPDSMQKGPGTIPLFGQREGEAPLPESGSNRATAPSQAIDADDPEVVETLERLDDLVYDAIAGQPDALDRLKAFWPRVRKELGAEMLADSQEQYLRYALAVWDECVRQDTVRDPVRALHSVEVLYLLFDQ